MSSYVNKESDEEMERDSSKYKKRSPPKRTRKKGRQPDSDSDDEDGHNEKLLLSMSELKVRLLIFHQYLQLFRFLQ